MADLLTRWIGRRAFALMERRGPDFIIGDGGDRPYMLRWYWIPKNRFFNVYVHRIVRDDDDRALHDHPWASLSIMVDGALAEVYRDRSGTIQERRIAAGRWVWRRATFQHRLALEGDHAVTVFITGPKLREWGFACPKGWVHWRDFVAKDDTGRIGRGCGEMDDA